MKIGIWKVIIVTALLIFTPSQAQVPDLPLQDERVYLGYHYGMAGIIDAYLTLDGPNANVDTLLNELWEGRFEDDGSFYPIWTREPGPQSFWTGIKYGTQGIVEVMVDYYMQTNETIWLDRSRDAYDLMSSQMMSENGTKWSYNFGKPNNANGISVTGLNFGSTSVVKNAISLYHATGNTSYFELASNAIDWMIKLTPENGAITWYSEDGFLDYTIYGYGSGIAGIVPVLLEYATLTANSTVLAYTELLTTHLLESQLDDGSWLIQDDRDYVSLDFMEGISGVLFGLEQILQLAPDYALASEIEAAIEDGITFLLSKALVDGEYTFLYDNDTAVQQIGLQSGMLGHLQGLIAVEEYLNVDQRELVQTLLDDFLEFSVVDVQIAGEDYILPLHSRNNNIYFDISYADGLVGYLLTLNSFLNSSFNFDVNSIENTLEGMKKSIDLFANDEGFFNKQISPKSDWQLGEMVSFTYFPTTRTNNSSSESEQSTFLPFSLLVIGMLIIRQIRVRYS